MKKEDLQDFIMLTMSCLSIVIPFSLFFWFLYKVAKGAYYLLNKLIDKL